MRCVYGRYNFCNKKSLLVPVRLAKVKRQLLQVACCKSTTRPENLNTLLFPCSAAHLFLDTLAVSIDFTATPQPTRRFAYSAGKLNLVVSSLHYAGLNGLMGPPDADDVVYDKLKHYRSCNFFLMTKRATDREQFLMKAKSIGFYVQILRKLENVI